jgi:hypothetical protein
MVVMIKYVYANIRKLFYMVSKYLRIITIF